MHAAKADKSPRLQRVLEALRSNPDGLTTMELISRASVCAVNSIAAELRENGFRVECRPVAGRKGVYRYRLEGAA